VMQSRKGFTLIEVLLALFIFAVMATIAATGLSTILKSRDRANANAERLQRLQIAMVIMQRDFEQMLDRPVIDGQGNRLSPVLAPRPEYIEFTRAGFVNPLMVFDRSSLQRVAYEYQDNKLIRITWPVLDRAPDTKSLSRTLLNDVTSMKIRYLSENNEFYSTWPPENDIAAPLKSPLPKAVEITLTIKHWGTFHRLYLIHSIGQTAAYWKNLLKTPSSSSKASSSTSKTNTPSGPNLNSEPDIIIRNEKE